MNGIIARVWWDWETSSNRFGEHNNDNGKIVRKRSIHQHLMAYSVCWSNNTQKKPHSRILRSDRSIHVYKRVCLLSGMPCLYEQVDETNMSKMSRISMLHSENCALCISVNVMLSIFIQIITWISRPGTGNIPPAKQYYYKI